MEEVEIRLCVNCRFMKVQSGAWYGEYCESPEMAIEQKMEYVHGRMVPEETRPYCRDTNTFGGCPGYQPKEKSKK